MSCKRKTPAAAIQADGGPEFVAPKPVTHPNELAQVDSDSPLLLPGRFVTCMAKLGGDAGKHHLVLDTNVDGVWEQRFELQLNSEQLPKLLLPREESRYLAELKLMTQGDQVVVTRRQDETSIRLPLDEWNWLIELVRRNPTGIDGSIRFPVSAARQIAYSVVSTETEFGPLHRIQLQIIGQRKELGRIRLLLGELRDLLDDMWSSDLRASRLGQGWIAIQQDTGNGVLHLDELQLAWQCMEIRDASLRYGIQRRDRWYRWQDDHGRIPSRELALKAARKAAEEQFPGSRFAQDQFAAMAYDAVLWEDLLERQGAIDKALEEGKG